MAENRRVEEAMELVYFVYPVCDGHCAHCWSSDLMLGRYKDAVWHDKMIAALAREEHSYREMKLSGGEPFLHPELHKIISAVRDRLGYDFPLTIFTSGRPVVSLKEGREGIEETKKALLLRVGDFKNVSLQMSVDEFHFDVLKRQHSWSSEEAGVHFRNYITNFIEACREIQELFPEFSGPKLKIHCEEGRLEYHKNEMFAWFPIDWWEKYAILTEGLVYAGNAKQLNHTFRLKPSERMSYFLLPGVDFYEEPVTKRAELFHKSGTPVYLDDSESSAVMISGWWNLIDREASSRKILIDEVLK